MVMRCVVEWPPATADASIAAVKLQDVKWMKDGTPIAELDKTHGADDLKQTGAELVPFEKLATTGFSRNTSPYDHLSKRRAR